METPIQNLNQLFEKTWAYTMQENPIFASICGDHQYNDRLPCAKKEHYDTRKKQEQSFLDELLTIPKEKLPLDDQENYELFKQNLEDSLKEADFNTILMPMNNVFGFHISLPELSNRAPMNDLKDYENYLSRLSQIPSYMNENIELMKEGIKNGYVSAKVAISGCDSSIEAQIMENIEKSPFYAPFLKFPKTISPTDQENLQKEGNKIIQNSVMAGYQELLNFFREEYLPVSREKIGASTLPNGKEFYEHRVRMYTSSEYTPEFVHQTGMEEIERIQKEMEEIIKEVKFDGTFQEFLHFLRTDPRFYVETPEQLLREVSYILKDMDGKLPGLFKNLPRMPYGIRPVPDYSAPKAPTAYYMPPAGDGSRAGFYYVNTYDLKSRPLYELETLSLHEAVPGHHLQIALQQELKDLPPFRRFSGFTSFMEGWALYSERLGLEVGCYSDPYSNFGRLTYEMWRSCRLVVDSGIHYMDWTREQAVQFMTKYTALSQHNIESEVDRYIAWPGQALSYKMGEIKIRELRKKAEKTLGSNFDIRDFHDVLLRRGAVPLSVLEGNVNNYLAEKKVS